MTRQRIEIVDWDDHYEVSQSRRTQLHKWVAIPNKHDGRGYARIAMMKDGPEIFCAWILLVQVASKMPKRGVLADSDGPLSIGDIAVKTRYPESIFQKAVKILSTPNIGWLRVVGHQSERDRSAVGAQSESGRSAVGAQSELHDMTEHDSTEHDNTKTIVPAARVKYDPLNESVPEWLENPWAEFCKHRSEIKSPMTPTAAKALIKKLKVWGEHNAKNAIARSIENGWKGVFPPDMKAKPKSQMTLQEEMQKHRDFALRVARSMGDMPEEKEVSNG